MGAVALSRTTSTSHKRSGKTSRTRAVLQVQVEWAMDNASVPARRVNRHVPLLLEDCYPPLVLVSDPVGDRCSENPAADDSNVPRLHRIAPHARPWPVSYIQITHQGKDDSCSVPKKRPKNHRV